MSNKQRTALMFESIFDIDIGAIRTMLENFANPKFLAYDKNDLTNDTIKLLLALRKDINPLTAILKPEYHGETANNLYKELKKGYMDSILSNSEPSAIYTVVEALLQTNSSMDFTVICEESYIQVPIVKELDNRFNIIDLEGNPLNIECLHDFDNIFLKDFATIFNDKLQIFLTKKNIYVSRLMFNMTPIMGELVPRMDINAIIGRANKVMLIDYYINLKTPQKPAEEEVKG